MQVAVQRHKFGVLLHIHYLQETLKKKGVDFSDARQILEICNPPEGGDTLGMYSLGLMYENGYGVEKDYQQAVMLYRKAAKGGVQHGKDALSA